MSADLQKERIMRASEEEILQEVLEAIRTIKYGSVQIVLQDGKVVQIEKVVKMRYPRRASLP